MFVIDAMMKGGFMMWPLLICSIFALAVLIDRVWYFAKVTHIDIDTFFPAIVQAVKQKNIEQGISLCNEKLTPLTAILKTALLNSSSSKQTIKDAVNEVSLYEVPKMERNLNFLATIAHVSPLLGLLGTVTGIIKCFAVIQTKASMAGTVNPADLAGGIMEALHTTAFGLVVAIPSFIIYNYFVSKVNFRVIEMERCATEVIALLGEE